MFDLGDVQKAVGFWLASRKLTEISLRAYYSDPRLVSRSQVRSAYGRLLYEKYLLRLEGPWRETIERIFLFLCQHLRSRRRGYQDEHMTGLEDGIHVEES